MLEAANFCYVGDPDWSDSCLVFTENTNNTDSSVTITVTSGDTVSGDNIIWYPVDQQSTIYTPPVEWTFSPQIIFETPEQILQKLESSMMLTSDQDKSKLYERLVKLAEELKPRKRSRQLKLPFMY